VKVALLDALAERVVPVLILALGFLLLGLQVARANGMGAPERVALDFMLWWSWLFGCALAMWLGSRAIARPLADRSALWELTRAIQPGVWGLRRLAATALVALCAHGVLLGAGLALVGPPPGWFAFVCTTSTEVLLLVALAGGLGALFPPLPALGLTLALWTTGHLGGLWLEMMTQSGQSTLASAFLAAIPDLDLLDVHGSVVRGRVPPMAQVLGRVAWGLAWTCAAAAATVAVLNRRDLA